MSKIKCKGTVLQQTLASSFVAVAQIIDMSGPDMEAQTAECDTLDNANAGIPYMSTGRSEGGSLSGNMFFDPALAGHTHILDLLTTPQSEAWKLIFADTGTSEWTFTGVGFSFSPTIALAEGLKASFAIKLDGLPTFPGSGSAA